MTTTTTPNTTTPAAAVEPSAMDRYVGKMLGDMGAAIGASLVQVGDELGLFKALADSPATVAQLARRTRTAERYVREWLAAMAASDYVTYDEASDSYALSPEQRAVFADENHPAHLVGFFDVCAATFRATEKIIDGFRTGRGVGWHEQHRCLFRGTERFFRTSYRHHLVNDWLPALDGVVDRLRAGIDVADVGCGHGASTIVRAQAFPRSRFRGFDYHPESIARAREAADALGLSDRVDFEVAPAKSYPGGDYRLVTFFDCLHDMGDPVGAAAHVRETLVPDGTWMVVEPFAHDSVAQNLNPVGRVYYAASTMICTPASLSQEVGLALGAQAGAKRLADVMRQGGFSRVRKATETPFNMVIEARP